jgi:hypothetical protein
MVEKKIESICTKCRYFHPKFCGANSNYFEYMRLNKYLNIGNSCQEFVLESKWNRFTRKFLNSAHLSPQKMVFCTLSLGILNFCLILQPHFDLIAFAIIFQFLILLYSLIYLYRVIIEEKNIYNYRKEKF